MAFTGEGPVSKAALLNALPPAWPEDLSQALQTRIRATGRKLVVLDDDPTGAQALSEAWVLTQWSAEALQSVLTDGSPLFFAVSNTRSMSCADAVRTDRAIATSVAEAAEACGVDFDVLVRGDSTLRGHFPHELDAVAAVLDARGRRFDGVILCPFFLEGGRLTAFDVLWVTEGDTLVPAGQTEYAKDRAFAYRASNLRDWVAEKTAGRVAAGDVVSVSLEVIRREGPEGVRRVLAEARGGRVVVVNAVRYRDLEVFASGLLDAEAAGQRFLFRTAASFLKVRSGLPDRGLLRGADFGISEGSGGLVIVGSYVQKSSDQLRAALMLDGVAAVELSVHRVLDAATRDGEVLRVSAAVDGALQRGREVVVFTSRDRDRAGDLDAGRQIGDALVAMVRGLTVRPRYAIAKGGNTALCVVRDGLHARRAWAMGQILPGVPVWRLGEESRFPGLPVVIFPGNVGQAESLVEAMDVLRKASTQERRIDPTGR